MTISNTTHEDWGTFPAVAASKRLPVSSSTKEDVRPGIGRSRGTAPRHSPLASINAATDAIPLTLTLRGAVDPSTTGGTSTLSSSTIGIGSGISTSSRCCQALLDAL
jgi:hypothetical protein